MTVSARFMCMEILGAIKSEVYTVPEGISIAGLMDYARELAGLEAADLLDQLLFLRNGSSATADTVLEDGDQVIFLRKLYGG